jgi:hypothetical protein
MLVVLENLVTCLFMNILIEDAEKMEYLTSNNQWTKNVADGKNFGGKKLPMMLRKKN